MALGQLNIYMEKTKLGPCISPYTKINFMWTANLNVNGKSIELLDDNMGEYLNALKVGKYFLNGTQKTLAIKENTEKLDTLKFKTSVHQWIL